MQRTSSGLSLGMAVLGVFVGFSPPLFAQNFASEDSDSDSGGPRPTPRIAPEDRSAGSELHPPELLKADEAAYPKEALDAGIEGRVLLELSISSGGTVTQAEVIDGLGYGLDEAASDAALRFVFNPAKKDGENKSSRIRYAYDFVLPPAVADPKTDPDESDAAPRAALTEERPRTAGPLGAAPEAAEELPQTTLASEETAEEVVVKGLRAKDKKLRSAAAVTVVDLERAKRESADVAEVLARVEGVNVQRMGGLGSDAKFSLAGFDDNQVRFFIDGIPLEYQGFSMGLQNVPLLFAERIDVYKGVVPVTLGADSLGGAFDLVTDRRTKGTRAFASHQGGSFDTHRLSAGARHLDDKTGLFVKAEGFFDSSENDYPINVQTGSLSGDVVDLTVRRSHDGYRTKGVILESGFVGRPWANRLLLRGFANGYQNELQHNALMTLPYGEAEFGGISRGLSLRYEHDFGQGLRGSFVTGYVYDRTDFVDNPKCVYDWYGQCLLDVEGRGELRERQTDQSVWDHTAFGRWNLNWTIARAHEVVLSTAPTIFTRKGEDRLLPETSNFNELKAQRDLFKWVSGAEYRTRLLNDRLENAFFVKNYLLSSQSEEIYNDYINTQKNAQNLYWGAGNGARLSLTEWAHLKASYEYSVRLPEPGELFGNTVQIVENLDLEPERSHNVNLSFLITDADTKSGLYNATLTGFYRDAQQLILLLGQTDVFRYDNAYEARVQGVEGAVSWLSPGDFLELGLNATYQDYRNRSESGSFAQFRGDRIPNKPYLFGNGTVRLLKQGAVTPRDELALTWYSRYTHEFLRGWESVSSSYVQPKVPAQFVHTAVVSYLVRGEPLEEIAFSAEGQNLTNEKVFDFYRVQKAGRAFYFKTSITY